MLRRLFVVLFATLIGVSVLVVAGSPANAANTASQSLFDDDADADTASIRRFAGANRYATAAALAEGYTESTDAGGGVDVIIVASGESIVDASAAAGLAGTLQVPVLLTATDELSSETEDFIDEEFISTVYIVGGTSAISEAVEAELNGLPTVSTVVRLAGDDRYSTSVDIAERIGDLGNYCETGEPAAILVNVDNSFADVIAIGPLAYVHSLPILLTSANLLSADVSNYLEDNSVERVFIVGGTSAISEGVENQLRAIGVTNTQRLAGADRYATAVEIYNELADCGTIALSTATIGLVNGSAAADGVAAGPLLGAGLVAPGQVTPVMLISTNGVPPATREFLANTPVRNANGSYLDVSFTAIGGLSVVPASVMDAAIVAATTSAPLTASVAASFVNEAFTNTATVSFSAYVDQATATDKGNYLLNGARLLRNDTLELIDTSSNTTPSTVLMTIGREFESGDVITVVGNKIKGRAADNRLTQETIYTVTEAPRADRTRPRIEIITGAGAHEFRIKVDEENPGPLGIDVSRISLNGEPLPWRRTLTRHKVVRTQRETAISVSELSTAYGTVVPLNSGYTYTAGNATSACVRTARPVDAGGSRLGPVTNAWQVRTESNDDTFNTVPRDAAVPRCPELQYFGLPLNDVTLTTAEAVYHMGDRTNFRVCLFGADEGVDSTVTVDPPCLTQLPTEEAVVADRPSEYSSTSPDDPTYYQREYGLTDIEEELGVLVDGRYIRYTTAYSTASTDTPAALSARDTITIEAGAVTDAFGNENRRTTFTVRENADAPELDRATVSRKRLYDSNGPAPGGEALASWAWAEYAWWCGASLNPSDGDCVDADTQVDVVANYLTITAKADGEAAGAIGNSWSIDWFQLDSDTYDGDGVPTIDVSYLSHRRAIQIGFDAEVRVEDVYNALLANEDLAENFDVSSDGTRTVGSDAAVAGWDRDPTTIFTRDLPDLIDPAACNADDASTCAAIPVAGADNSVDAVGAAKGTAVIRGAPSTAVRNFSGGESAVTITLTYDDVLETFRYSVPANDSAGTAIADNMTEAAFTDLVEANASTAAATTVYPLASGWDEPSDIRIVQGETYKCLLPSPATCMEFADFENVRQYPTLAREITFVLHSPDLNRLPDSDDTINLPASLAENYESTAASVAVAEQDLRAG